MTRSILEQPPAGHLLPHLLWQHHRPARHPGGAVRQAGHQAHRPRLRPRLWHISWCRWGWVPWWPPRWCRGRLTHILLLTGLVLMHCHITNWFICETEFTWPPSLHGTAIYIFIYHNYCATYQDVFFSWSPFPWSYFSFPKCSLLPALRVTATTTRKLRECVVHRVSFTNHFSTGWKSYFIPLKFFH